MSEVRKRPRFHWGILLILSIIVLAVTFAGYMMNSSLEETLTKERDTSIITHDYTYDTPSQAEQTVQSEQAAESKQ
jgi:hypothetical protein